MRPHAEFALEQEQKALRALKDGNLEQVLWFRILASQGWRDAAAEASTAERAQFLLQREHALRELAIAADRLADQVHAEAAGSAGGAPV